VSPVFTEPAPAKTGGQARLSLLKKMNGNKRKELKNWRIKK